MRELEKPHDTRITKLRLAPNVFDDCDAKIACPIIEKVGALPPSCLGENSANSADRYGSSCSL